MSQPFGAMPADRELAAFGVGVSGLMLGIVTVDLVSAVITGKAPPLFVPAALWLSAVLAAVVLLAAAQVSGVALRIALLAFAGAQLLSVASAVTVVPFGSWIATVLDATFGCALLVAAWRRSGSVARRVAVVMFVTAAVFKIWLTHAPLGLSG